MKKNKIAWLESTYLFPQHFQQQERYLENLIEARTQAIQPYIRGFLELAIDQATLKQSQIGLISASGIMPDGTPFSIPEQQPLPTPLAVNRNIKDQKVYLVLPNYQPGHKHISQHGEMDRITRYKLEEIEIYDYSQENDNVERLESAQLNFRLILESEEMGGLTVLPIAKIMEVTAEGAIRLDSKFIAPMLNVSSDPELKHQLNNFIGLVQQRADILSKRFIESPETGGATAFTEFMILQLLNRYEPKLEHFKTLELLHPETLYRELISLQGELSTFTSLEKRPNFKPNYLHDDLYQTFVDINIHLSQCFATVLEQTAFDLDLTDANYGVYISKILDTSLFGNARFILAIKADVPSDKLRNEVPDHIKVGSVDNIKDLVNNQLKGVSISALPSAPRELDFRPGFVYFELDTEPNDQWKIITKSNTIAVHLAGDYPQPILSLWAIPQ